MRHSVKVPFNSMNMDEGVKKLLVRSSDSKCPYITCKELEMSEGASVYSQDKMTWKEHGII